MWFVIFLIEEKSHLFDQKSHNKISIKPLRPLTTIHIKAQRTAYLTKLHNYTMEEPEMTDTNLSHSITSTCSHHHLGRPVGGKTVSLSARLNCKFYFWGSVVGLTQIRVWFVLQSMYIWGYRQQSIITLFCWTNRLLLLHAVYELPLNL